MDPTSRILVFEAIKTWRKNKTTIVITHDLSQITKEDFVYVMKNGSVVEQGYRSDLASGQGEFSHMMDSQRETGGFLPEEEDADELATTDEDSDTDIEDSEKSEVPWNVKHQSVALRPITLGYWMFDVVADLTVGKPTIEPAPAPPIAVRRRRSSLHLDTQSPTEPTPAYTVASRRYSLPFTPASPTFAPDYSSATMLTHKQEEVEFDNEKYALARSGDHTRSRRSQPRARFDHSTHPLNDVSVTSPIDEDSSSLPDPRFVRPPFWALVREMYPGVPYKPLFFFGLLVCLASGGMTPVFSYLLSRLLFEVSTGATDTRAINVYGGIVLAVAALDGILIGSKYFLMETVAMSWITKIRKISFGNVLAQDKKWFEKEENSPVRLVQVLVKDGDDARNLIAVVAGQAVVVISMLSVGLLWAMARGWQLTLVGLAIAPVFAGVMAVQTSLVAKCEVRNKRAREEVAKGYYDVCIILLLVL